MAAAAVAATSVVAAREEGDERTDWGDYAVRGARSLTVLPVLIHDLPQRQELTSWRSWGGVQTEDAANEEVTRITEELDDLAKAAMSLCEVVR